MEIVIKNGTTLIDREFKYLFNKYHGWYVDKKGYVRRSNGIIEGKRKAMLLHRVIIDAQPGIQVDHINGNKSDNRKINLRLCTNAQNARNKGLNVTNKSGFKGVHFKKKNGKWCAQIKVNGSVKYLGLFITPEEAYKAYQVASDKYFKEFNWKDQDAHR